MEKLLALIIFSLIALPHALAEASSFCTTVLGDTALEDLKMQIRSGATTLQLPAKLSRTYLIQGRKLISVNYRTRKEKLRAQDFVYRSISIDIDPTTDEKLRTEVIKAISEDLQKTNPSIQTFSTVIGNSRSIAVSWGIGLLTPNKAAELFGIIDSVLKARLGPVEFADELPASVTAN